MYRTLVEFVECWGKDCMSGRCRERLEKVGSYLTGAGRAGPGIEERDSDVDF